MPNQFNRFLVCFLDVLGFEFRFNKLGLGGMLEKYLELIHIVDQRNEATDRWFGSLNFTEGAYWTSEGNAFISARLYGAYGSDSILLFAHADFPENRYPEALNSSVEERQKWGEDPAQGWRYHTVPCDAFLDLCNEVICHSIEIGLPLRGALSIGEAVLHLDERVFLGQPLIDTARLEHAQQCIGASFASPFMTQVVPKRYQLSFSDHFKKDVPSLFSGSILDWPRHWRKTRTHGLLDALRDMNVDPKFDDYYKKTEAIALASQEVMQLYETPEETYITKVYPQYASPLLELPLRLVRSEPIQGNTEELNTQNQGDR
ncbi:hypothetical protein [Pseudomonas moorei]|uniref:hypothetical protein n=1 Tax=Pseudomonas moorei TaxID=395599 RepID=UPI001FF491FE|nr:hypothetical protein [Pseudomonas moorei]